MIATPAAALTALERRVADEVARREDELVELLADLIGFDTRAPDPDFAPRDEAALQAYVAERLRRAGLEVDVWEPDPAQLDFERYPNPPGYTFRGRPQLLARAPGAGGGRSLLFNGHVDVVTVEPREQWSSDPLAADVRHGRVYGRGACDMKGGVAAMLLATEVLRSLEVALRGDLLVNTVTDEESTGAGTLASVARGASADAALIPEPTDLTAWLGTRGSLLGRVVVDGRAGHAGLAQAHWSEGGAVNAVEKMQLLLGGLVRLREEWRTRPDVAHPHLHPSALVPTSLSGGEWIVTYPPRCTLDVHVHYTPGHADERGFGSRAEREIEERLLALAATDDWLAEHPPRFEWSGDSPASFHAPGEPVPALLLATMPALGLAPEIATRTTFYDGAILSRAGTPGLAFGPGDIQQAHAVDEYVPIDELVKAAQVLAVAAMRCCGVAER
jgi:acetylornithine deacetylase